METSKGHVAMNVIAVVSNPLNKKSKLRLLDNGMVQEHLPIYHEATKRRSGRYVHGWQDRYYFGSPSQRNVEGWIRKAIIDGYKFERSSISVGIVILEEE